MMIEFVSNTAEVENVSYVGRGGEMGNRDMMRFDLSDGEAVRVPNPEFSVENPALCTLAYLGGRPSDLEAAEGSTLPYVYDEMDVACVPKIVVSNGREILENADWFEGVEMTYVEVE